MIEPNKKIVITGGFGFVGRHLARFLMTKPEFDVVQIGREIFDNSAQLIESLKGVNTIVHLAAVNRHDDSEFIEKENFRLAESLVNACEAAKIYPHFVVSSSTQENLNNIYGNAKKAAREHISEWAINHGTSCAGLIIPNVFGPFGKPNYNSFIPTFCQKIIHGDVPTIIEDREVELIYVNKLVELIYNEIIDHKHHLLHIPFQFKKKVSAVLSDLLSYYEDYFRCGTFPSLEDEYHLALFNTFRCYIPHNHYPVLFTLNTDSRGSFVELARTNTSGQSSYSTTHQGITRGNHYHTRKAERFAVISGKARIDLRLIDTNEVISYEIDGDISPGYVDIPIWHTHNITNIGDSTLMTMFWINEPYNQEDPDTYFVKV